ALNLGHPESSRRAGDPHIARCRELEATTQAPATDPGDHGHGKQAYALAQGAQHGDKGPGRARVQHAHLRYGRAAGEGPVAATAQDEDPEFRYFPGLVKGLRELGYDGRAEDVD